MSLVYTGPFSTASFPVGQRIAGWSNNATGAGTVFNRYRDGDPQSTFAWWELSGNLNYQLATSRRLICSCRFNGPTSADPTKAHTAVDWDTRESLYTIIGPIELLPNVRRGIDNAPLLTVRVRARMVAGAGAGAVRVYAVGREHDIRENWVFTASRATGYVNFAIASNTYPASPGFSAASSLTIPLDPVNTYCGMQAWSHPSPIAAIEEQQVDVLATYLAVAGVGDDTNGLYIAGLEIWEEAPAA